MDSSAGVIPMAERRITGIGDLAPDLITRSRAAIWLLSWQFSFVKHA
jgi:hypothetical protein